MKSRLSLAYSLEIWATLVAGVAVLAVLQTFVIGRHYIIPTGILVVAVLFGNLARCGFQNRLWAKQVLFWFAFLFTCHAFFALFWSKRYRELLGESFELVCGTVVVVFAALIFDYARHNHLFGS